MIFMSMTHARDYCHPTTIMTLRPVFPSSPLTSERYPLGGPLTTLFGRSSLGGGRSPSIRSSSLLLALRLWPWRRSQKNKTSFEDISVLSFARLAVMQTITLCLWPTTPISAYSALSDGIAVYLIFYYYFSY